MKKHEPLTHGIFHSGSGVGCSSGNFEYIYFDKSELGALISRTETYRGNVTGHLKDSITIV